MLAKDITGGGKIDYVLMSLYISLVAIGWLMIYAVGYKQQGYEMDWNEFLVKTSAGKQTIFIIISGLLMLLVFSLDAKFWRVFTYPLYGISILLLLAVLIFGREINGAKAWFTIGGFGFQPVELAKWGTSLALSSYLASPSVSLKEPRAQFTILGLMALPLILILLQPDPGSMLVFVSFAIVLFREGLSPTPYFIGLALTTIFITALKLNNVPELLLYLMMLISLLFAFNIADKQRWWIGGVIALIVASAYLFFNGKIMESLFTMLGVVTIFAVVHSRRGRFRLVIMGMGSLIVACTLVFLTNFLLNNVLKNHHRERINVWLNIDKCDPRGIAYNVINSKMAIGAGGLQGKGFLEGTMTKLSFVPEQSTDFIFCTIGEEQGFLGVFAVLIIFALFLIRLIQMAERQRAPFSRIYGYCLVGIFFFHFFINIGMTMGLLPVVGIPLPFVSAGGSSLLSFTVMLAVFIKLDSSRYIA
jgi:rod shape determining protein RodA